MERTGDKTLSTPAIARLTVRWAIELFSAEPKRNYYSLLVAKAFTAFMFEGVIHHLGEKMCGTWNDPRPRANGLIPLQSLARQPLKERHKGVRRFLGLDSNGSDFQDLQKVVDRVIAFRDNFAHPKVHRENFSDVIKTELDRLPDIAWESQVDAQDVEQDYLQIEKYSESLLDVAANLLEKTYELGWTAHQQEYRHLTNLTLEAAYLRAFLLNPYHSSVDIIA